MVPVLFLNILFFKETLNIDLTRLIKLVLFLFLNILVDHIVDLLIGHVVLLDLVSNFVEYCFVPDSYSKQSLFELVIAQASMIII